MIGLDLLMPNDADSHFYGVTVGIVTNNQDPEHLGRIKVRYPWLSETVESSWARVLTSMAGNNRGVYFLPDVDDEVLLAFEQGDINFPYVLGSLWNGKDKPPVKNGDGKNNQKMIQSRSGHKIILDDTQDREQIIIQDKTGKNKIVIDSQANQMNIEVAGDLTLTAKGKINLNSSQDDVVIECKNLSIKTKESYQLSAGKNCTVKAQAKYELEAKSGLGIKCSAGVKVNDGSLEVM